MSDPADPTVAMIVVQWFIKAGREGDFFDYRKPIDPGMEGVIGESLFRATVDDADEEASVFLNIGYWRSREDFYRAFPGSKRGVAPPQQEFEARPRRRHWLGPV